MRRVTSGDAPRAGGCAVGTPAAGDRRARLERGGRTPARGAGDRPRTRRPWRAWLLAACALGAPLGCDLAEYRFDRRPDGALLDASTPDGARDAAADATADASLADAPEASAADALDAPDVPDAPDGATPADASVDASLADAPEASAADAPDAPDGATPADATDATDASADAASDTSPLDVGPGVPACPGATCGGRCVDLNTDRLHCGACDRACPVPAHAERATCTAAVCGVVCAAGFVAHGGACVAPPVRPIAPLSTAVVTSQRPTFWWALADGADGADVEVCRDRACTMTVARFTAPGPSGTPPASLPPGVLFWRLRERVGGTTVGVPGAVWQFTVGARSAPVATSFGSVLDVNGDGYADLAVGAQAAAGDTGRVHVYLGGAAGLATTPAVSLTGPDGEGGAFGYSVASAGDVNGDGYADVAVGAYGVASRTGRVHVYLGGAAGLATTPAVSLTGPDGAFGFFGVSVASAGDVNGDGYADVAVGAFGVAGNTGRVHVYLGGAAGLATTPAVSLTGPDGASGNFGDSVASAGDVNGDGYADVAVGAFGVAGNTGRVHVYLGGAAGLAMTPAVSHTGPDGASGNFGYSVASAGDVNGDGYADLAVGANGAAGNTGRVHIYLGGAAGLASTPAVSLTGPDGAYGSFGLSVASAGDVNGDGYADLAVGANGVASRTGRVHVYRGGAAGLATTPAVSLTGPDGASGNFGDSVASAGDVNGDGYADLAVGANGAASGTGRVHVYRGGAAGLATTPAVSLTGPDGAYGFFGDSVASAGDVNGDGYRGPDAAGRWPGSAARRSPAPS